MQETQGNTKWTSDKPKNKRTRTKKHTGRKKTIYMKGADKVNLYLQISQHIGLVRTGRYTRALPQLKQNARRPPSLKVQARDASKHELQDDTAHSSFKGASCRSIWLLQALAGPARLKQVALILP